jgi:uncharacterized repeat protein (TIGR02543 family)
MKSKSLFLLGFIITFLFVACSGNTTIQNSTTATTELPNSSETTLIPTSNETTLTTSITTYEPTTAESITTSSTTTEDITTTESLTYNVFLETNGGILDSYTIDNLQENDVVTLPIPTREGYIFCGWYLSIDSDMPIEEATITSSDITFYADWASEGLSYELINDDTEYEVSIGDVESLTSVSIPKFYQGIKVTRIANQGFAYVEMMNEIILPNTIVEIGNGAFLNAYDLQNLVIPASVEIIGNTAFRGCYSLEFFSVSEVSPFLSSVDGVLYNEDQSVLIRYPQAKITTEFIIPLSVVIVREDAFGNNHYLSSIIITENVTTLNDHAFYNCTALTSMTIPDNVTSVGIYLFRESAIQEVTLGAGLSAISSYMFYNCYQLETIIIPDNINSIGYAAFDSCSSLTSIIITRPSSSGLITGAVFMFINTNLQLKIYFPDQGTLDLYKLETYWSSYKEKFEVYIP